MTRLAKTATTASLAGAAYALLLLDVLPLPLVALDTKAQLLPVIPWWLLVALGSYCLWTLGVGIATFGECSGAYEELLQEINQAKYELRSKGVSVD